MYAKCMEMDSPSSTVFLGLCEKAGIMFEDSCLCDPHSFTPESGMITRRQSDDRFSQLNVSKLVHWEVGLHGPNRLHEDYVQIYSVT